MKSRWNCGSMTCIMCLTCVGSQLSINSSSWTRLFHREHRHAISIDKYWQ
uniref:Uncharacterized protein n=1 Tax=Oncorhynchus kisutch TaxID=8019 RepID=A0A8C7D6L4_ONCKI